MNDENDVWYNVGDFLQDMNDENDVLHMYD